MHILVVLGTRPEAIKLAPIINNASLISGNFIKVCSTGQHKEMLEQVLTFFNIKPDYTLQVMRDGQSLSYLSSKILTELTLIVEKEKPDIIIVQGDTTTAFIGALVGFYNKIPVAHIEAGLRSFNMYSPFPEEVNRMLISRLATFHFCPTKAAVNNLQLENISQNVVRVGNTVIDALFMGLEQIKHNKSSTFLTYFDFLDFSKKIVLITAHRRESFGKPFEHICQSITKAAKCFPEVQFVYPVHFNPSVRKPVFEILSHQKNIFLIDLLKYEHFIWLLSQSYLVLTDSGGIQEEAPSLKIPVLVMRDVTERMEGVQAGNAKLVGTKEQTIFNHVRTLLTDNSVYHKMIINENPYGDGKASDKILRILTEKLR